MNASALLESFFRREGPRVLAVLIAESRGDLDTAEEAFQEACSRAALHWSTRGVPPNPAAWLTVVARRCVIDARRRDEKHESADVLSEVEAPSLLEQEHVDAEVDERLKVLILCCHPSLEPRNQVSLALKLLCGLTTREIARAFLEDERATAQRLVRAKAKIREAGISVELPSGDALAERLSSVFLTNYLMFNEGYAATESDQLIRADLCVEAIRLQRLTIELLPTLPGVPTILHAEAKGLLALMLFHHARAAARIDSEGVQISLEKQNRALFDQQKLTEATRVLDEALELKAHGAYQLQAAIAALHANAPSAAQTDWPQIAGLYGSLLKLQPTAMVEMNAAIATAFAFSMEEGLTWLRRLSTHDDLKDSHLIHASIAELLVRLHRHEEAVKAYDTALSRVKSPAERLFLERRRREALH